MQDVTEGYYEKIGKGPFSTVALITPREYRDDRRHTQPDQGGNLLRPWAARVSNHKTLLARYPYVNLGPERQWKEACYGHSTWHVLEAGSSKPIEVQIPSSWEEAELRQSRA